MDDNTHLPRWLPGPLETGGSPLAADAREVVARISAAERSAALSLPSDDPLDPERRRRVEATGPELRAQPQAVVATWDHDANELQRLATRLASDVEQGRLRRVLLVGAGDSLAVMMAAREGLTAGLGVPCEPLQSLDLAFYPPPDLDAGVLVIALSSSGQTPRTVEAALVAQAAGARTLALTNSPASTLAAQCSDTLLVAATRVGWPTQSSTAALALLLRLGALVAVARGVPGAGELLGALDAAPAAMAATITDLDDRVDEIVARDVVARGDAARVVVFSAGGPDWGSAVMGAAKVRECTPGHAIAVQVEEFHHYNSLKAGEPLWLLAPDGRCLPRALDTAREAVRWGGSVHAVVTAGQHALDALARDVLVVPALPQALTPLVTVLPAQFVGYHLARAQFAAAEADPDA